MTVSVSKSNTGGRKKRARADFWSALSRRKTQANRKVIYTLKPRKGMTLGKIPAVIDWGFGRSSGTTKRRRPKKDRHGGWQGPGGGAVLRRPPREKKKGMVGHPKKENLVPLNKINGLTKITTRVGGSGLVSLGKKEPARTGPNQNRKSVGLCPLDQESLP